MSDETAIAEPQGGVRRPDNMRDQLRRKREEIGSQETIDLDVPGYDGMLVARYRSLPYDEIKAIADSAEAGSNPRKELVANADFLIRACEQVLIRDEAGLRPISADFPEIGEEPCGFDVRLAQALALEGVDSARQVILKVFNNDLGLVSQYIDVSAWMSSSRKAGDEDF